MRKTTVHALRTRRAEKTTKHAKRGQLEYLQIDEIPGYEFELSTGRRAVCYRDSTGKWWTLAPETGLAIAGGFAKRAAAVDAAERRAVDLEALVSTDKWGRYVQAFNEARENNGTLWPERYNAIMNGGM